MLDEIARTGNIAGLFHKGVDWRNPKDLHSCEWAFKNLTLHYIETAWPEVFNLVRFDDVKVEMMLRRFYRDAFGVWHFKKNLKLLCPDEQMRKGVLRELDRLSIRIKSTKPRLTRVAAAFSLWMSTIRPVYLLEKPATPIKGLWHLDAAINFYIVTSYLSFYGDIRIGTPGYDRKTRLRRVYYDFTCRDLNLSSLEMLYCSIFEPDASLDNEADSADEDDDDFVEEEI